MGTSIVDASSELEKVTNTWEKIINDLSNDKNRQISPAEAQRLINFFHQEERRIRLFYATACSDHGFSRQVDSFSNEYRAKLEVALLDGNRRYDAEIHRRKIESIQTWGKFLNDIKFNIVAFVLGIFTTGGYFIFGN